MVKRMIVPDSISVEEGIKLMVGHSRFNPGHGYNCACKDSVLMAVREGLHHKLDLTDPLVKANISYLFSAINNRS